MVENRLEILKAMRLGERVAEEEVNSLEEYFIETNQWNEIYNGEKDLVFGSKGAGKSALYALLNKRSGALQKKSIYTSLAENPSGATVFKNLEIDPPPTELAFIQLWKLYILTLLAEMLSVNKVKNELAQKLIQTLHEVGLLPNFSSRESLFKSAKSFIGKLFDKRVGSLESSITLDPSSGLPILTGKINLDEAVDKRADSFPVDELLNIANLAFEKEDMKAWILFDRLDVAFSENSELERNALRALFRSYRDLRRFQNIWIKLFIRDDVWDRITEDGFAEASHLTRSTTITWDASGLRNLLARRLAGNDLFLAHVGITNAELVESAEVQIEALDRILPDKVDIGKNPATFDWMLSRVSDGSNRTTPRELIHLFDAARRIQISRLERGELMPEGEVLFERPVFKEALKEVSNVRYKQTFRAENPGYIKYTDALKTKKTEQTVESLSSLWEIGNLEAKEVAEKLVNLGFFEKRKAGETYSYWVPFIYRDALEMVQGKADP